MCGITGGVWDSTSEPITRDVLARMTTVLSHRGPDGSGEKLVQYENGSGIALGHRRLSIIDLGGGHQPMCNENGDVWITFNGEIYNYRELRSQLESLGHRFATDSDTETIVHSYEEWGADCLQRLVGMFAFAIWDERQRSLLLARDRLGQKPLVYCQDNGRLLFASEIKSLLQAPGIARVVDETSINDYLTYLYVPHPRTMFKGICKLAPAHYAVYKRGRLRVQSYWAPDFNARSSHTPAELRDQLEAALEESVRLRLRSDVPLGAFLSGGIDSTVIVGLMQRHSRHPTQTYTIGFPVSDFDERGDARIIADHLGTDHHEFQVKPDSLDVLPTLIWHFDEPFGDSSSIPTYFVSQVTREHVKVALTGDGGDELFGGYPRYQTVSRVGQFERLPRVLQRLVANPLWDLVPTPNRESSVARRLCFRMRVLREPKLRRYVHWVSHFHDSRRGALYSDDFSAQFNGSDTAAFFVNAIEQCSQRSPGTQAMLADLQTYLPCDLLAKVDVTSMAHGLECRSPFLDHRVVELATAMPYRQKINGRGRKRILKETFRQLIPDSIVNRRKMGFSVPLGQWFRNELSEFVRQRLLDPVCLGRGYFRPDSIRDLIEEHQSKKWDHGERLWAMLCLELWHEAFIDPCVPPESAPASPRRPLGVG